MIDCFGVFLVYEFFNISLCFLVFVKNGDLFRFEHSVSLKLCFYILREAGLELNKVKRVTDLHQTYELSCGITSPYFP